MATLINNVADYFCEVVSSLLKVSDLHLIIFPKIGPYQVCFPKEDNEFSSSSSADVLHS